MQNVCNRGQRTRGDSRDPIGKSERQGLGRDLAENQHHHEHDRGRDIGSELAEVPNEEGRRETLREHIRGFIQTDDRDQRFQGTAHQAVQRFPHRASQPRSRMFHADQREERGLRSRQRGANQDQYDD